MNYNKEYIKKELYQLRKIGDIDIVKSKKKYINIFDEIDGKSITFHYPEFIDYDFIFKKIWMSSKLEMYLCKNVLASYLFKTLDLNCLVTLERIYFMLEEQDYVLLENETGDEYARTIMRENLLGVLWFEKNICIIDIRNIMKTAMELISEEIGNEFEFLKDINREILITTIHELRHLLLDTNVVLPEDLYPNYFADEKMVEQYAIELYEENGSMFLFQNLDYCDLKLEQDINDNFSVIIKSKEDKS